MDIKEVIRCLTLSEIREEGIKILERTSDENIKLIQQPLSTSTVFGSSDYYKIAKG